MKIAGFLMTGSQYIVQFFMEKDIQTVFGYAGGPNLHLLNEIKSMENLGKLKFYMNRHEQFVGHSAEGYAKASGKIGCSIVTSGPGITNMITPLQDALSDHIPLLCISGQVSSESIGTRAFQEVDAIGLTKYCTKWNRLIQNVDDLPLLLHYAYDIAFSDPPGPVHLDICSNVFSTPMKRMKKFEKKDKFLVNRPLFDDAIMKELLQKMKKSKRPVFILGKGAIHAKKELRAISKLYKIPMATTLHGLGILDETQNESLQMLGMHGTAFANKAVQMADLIIGVGNRFDDRTIGKKSEFGKQAKHANGIIHVDINKRYTSIAEQLISPNMTIHLDSKLFCTYILDHLRMEPNWDWYHEISELKNSFPMTYSTSNYLKIQDVLTELENQLKDKNDHLITTGVGNHQMMTAQYLNWKEPNQLLSSGSLGTMGVGVPFAIGAHCAHPQKTIICIDGDGSFMMSMQELATLKEYNIPIKVFIMNDDSLQMVTTWQDLFYNGNHIATKPLNPSFVDLGKAFGLKSFFCDDKKNVQSIIEEALSIKNRPVIVEFKVQSDICTPFVVPGKELDNMIL